MQRRLRVQDVSPPVRRDELGQQHGNFGPALRFLAFQHVDVLQQRADHRTVGRFEDHQWHAQASGVPLRLEFLSRSYVVGDVDGHDLGTHRVERD